MSIKDNNNMVHYYGLTAPSSPPPEPEEIQIIKPVTIKFKSVRILTIARNLLKEVDGKDKVMKIIQYFIKILLHYKLAKAKYWSTITSNFSMTRKILRLGNGIGPFKELLSDQHLTLFEQFSQFNDLVNTISDDIFCLYKLGLFNQKIGKRSEVIAAYCWFIGIFIDLKKNIKSYTKLKSAQVKDEELSMKIYLAEISIAKLFMDAVFCACDIWHPSYSSSVQAWTGFFSGSLAGYKLLMKHTT